jgi:hypothetical protein
VNKCNGSTSVVGIVTDITASMDNVDKANVQQDIADFLQNMQKAGVLTLVDPTYDVPDAQLITPSGSKPISQVDEAFFAGMPGIDPPCQ